ncbi:MAG TPA: exo-beta-N-acetylmuramidase NamZ domain-containing protein [Bryobacteraceae bacterium]|nr:exo-beta-N-acetylmuramidase NamZ domain-containing protein [Bryobacteraceae bacterium]
MKTRLLLLAAAVLVAPLSPAWGVFPGSRDLDAAIERAIQEDQIPGAVLLVSHHGKIVHRKAYGFRSLTPRREKMTLDTIFDAASLTKVVATTSAVMKLFEDGKLRLNDRVTVYLPEFQGGKSNITVRDLLTHFSGLRPDLDLKPEWKGYETGIRLALADTPVADAGTRFIYSDINFILLGEIVRRVSGNPLPEYAGEHVFRPLGMKDTMFQPPARLRRRIAPTETVPGHAGPLRGVVHDPTSRYMGGIAGHAGLFTTADDLSRFAGMMLGMGQPESRRIFSPLVVRKFTEPQSPPSQPILRGLGWDIDSPFSGNRGELFPIGSYGHTGFTGTSLWIDPATQSYVILLANSVHPRLRPPITSLRCRVATVVAASLDMKVPAISITGYNEAQAGLRRVVARNGQVLTGLDVLAAQNFAPLAGKRVGLITNHTGLDRNGRRNVDLMLEAGIAVKALFSPEHGIAGREDTPDVGHATDPATGLPIWSLYSGQNRRPTEEMLRDLDVLVFDVQDIGVRFYTYVSTMGYAMEEAARGKLPFYVLDRPNPLTGIYVEGPVLDKELESFIGYFPLPLRHGMTAGELARLFNEEKSIGADLHVVAMQGWQRGDWFDSTGLVWVDPSPNMRSFNAALLYPGVALLEYARNYSVGRGTDAPFEQVGADWINGRELAAELNSKFIPGVRFYPTRFRPASSNFEGALIEGVRFVITDREAFRGERLGLEIAAALGKLYPGKILLEANRGLIGSVETIAALETGEEPREIQWKEEQKLREFVQLRKKYLLYQ